VRESQIRARVGQWMSRGVVSPLRGQMPHVHAQTPSALQSYQPSATKSLPVNGSSELALSLGLPQPTAGQLPESTRSSSADIIRLYLDQAITIIRDDILSTGALGVSLLNRMPIHDNSLIASRWAVYPTDRTLQPLLWPNDAAIGLRCRETLLLSSLPTFTSS
jgi:hypothetical protein